MPTPLELEVARLRASRGEVSDPDLLGYLKGLGARGASTAYEAVEPILNVLARPQTALSEAYGAYQAGDENELSAALRGFLEGPEGAEYGTFGEQFVPEEEGEGFGRKAGRFAVDVATDPLNLLFGTGIGRGIVGKGLSKAVSPAIRKTATAVKAQPWAQGLARYTVPYSKIWGMFGDEAGSVGARKATEGFFESRRRVGEFTEKLAEIAKKAGLDDEGLLRVSDELEAAAPEVSDLGKFLRQEFDKVAEEAQKTGIMVTDPRTGRLLPFRREENYFPRMFRAGAKDEIDEFLAKLPDDLPEGRAERLRAIQRKMNEPGTSKFVRNLAKQLNVPEEQAKRILREEALRPRRVGHLEMMRTQMPEELEQFLERNPLEVGVRYMERVIPRIEMAKQFGPNYEKLTQLLDASMDAGMSSDIARDIGQIIKGVTPTSKLGRDNWFRGATALQALGKLGPTTSVANFSQLGNAGVREGLGSFLKSSLAHMKPAERRAAAGAYISDVRGHLEALTGQSKPTGVLPMLAQRWLNVVGFTPIERNNRIFSAIAGKRTAERIGKRWRELKLMDDLPESAARELKRLEKQLDAYGMRGQDKAYLLQEGRLGPVGESRVGLKASEITQHSTHPWEMPPAWRTPEMRLLFQFKRFAYNQSRFLYDEVAKPAYKWLETNGTEGDIMPFVRALALYPPAGVAVGTFRDWVRDIQAWFVGAKRRPSRRDFDNHPTATLLKDMMYVGSFGMAADVLERAYYGQFLDFLAGPTVSDAAEMLERAARSGLKATEGEFPTIEDLLMNAYRVAGRGALGLSPGELQTASTRRGLPGAAREMLQNASESRLLAPGGPPGQ